MHIRPAALLAVTLSLLTLPLAAKPICRWVDGSGRTQISEVVPDRYRDLATCTDSQTYELTPQQRRAAEQRADEARAKAVTDTTDCATWWRLYEESAACFGPFRTNRGATRAEAFDVCNEIPSPEPKCGSASR